jgi:uncharacterized protein (DUF2062 family)
LVQAGAVLAGATGVLAGSVLGGVIFGILAVWLAYRWIDQLATKSNRADATRVAAKARSGAAG